MSLFLRLYSSLYEWIAMAFVRKEKTFRCVEVRPALDELFCPSEYYMIVANGIQIGHPLTDRDVAYSIVNWLNTVDYAELIEDQNRKH